MKNKQLICFGIIFLIIAVGLSGCTETKSQSFDSRLDGYWYSEEDEIFYFMAFSPSSFGHGVLGEGLTEHGDYQIESNKLVCNYRNEYTGNETTKTFYYSLTDNDENLTLTEIDTGRIIVLKREWETVDRDYSTLKFVKDDVNKTLTVESCGENLIWDYLKIGGTGEGILPDGSIDVGDTIINCSGEIILIYTPMQTMLGSWTFS